MCSPYVLFIHSDKFTQIDDYHVIITRKNKCAAIFVRQQVITYISPNFVKLRFTSNYLFNFKMKLNDNP